LIFHDKNLRGKKELNRINNGFINGPVECWGKSIMLLFYEAFLIPSERNYLGIKGETSISQFKLVSI